VPALDSRHTRAHVAFAVAAVGLVLGFQDRIGLAATLAGTIGAVGGVLGPLGSYPLLFLRP